MIYLGLLALAVGLGLPISVLSAALAQGNIGVAALEGIARQPEASSRIQTVLILSMALIESLVIYVLLTFFILSGKLPTLSAQQVTDLIQSSTVASQAK
jgi:F-type H+-transporting ATPase subunit c